MRNLFLIIFAIAMLTSFAVKAVEDIDWKALDLAERQIKEFEGFKSLPYRAKYKNNKGELVLDKPTIGYGFTNKDIVKHYQNGMSKEDAESILRGYVSKINKKLGDIVPEYNKLSSGKKAALIDFYYNVGVGNFIDSTLYKECLVGFKYQRVPSELKRWKYIKKKESKGLIRRRKAEIDLWLNQ